MSREEFERKKYQVDWKIPKGYFSQNNFSPRKSREKINEKIKRKKTRKKPFVPTFLIPFIPSFLRVLNSCLLTFFFLSLTNFHVRARCVEECKMPDLALLLSLEHGDYQTDGSFNISFFLQYSLSIFPFSYTYSFSIYLFIRLPIFLHVSLTQYIYLSTYSPIYIFVFIYVSLSIFHLLFLLCRARHCWVPVRAAVVRWPTSQDNLDVAVHKELLIINVDILADKIRNVIHADWYKRDLDQNYLSKRITGSVKLALS